MIEVLSAARLGVSWRLAGSRGGQGRRRLRASALTAPSIFLALALPPPASAQLPESSNDAVRVFLDCHTRSCDSTSFRTDITFVHWVRDRQDAQVHVIITSVETGGGGAEFRLEFFGLEALEGKDDVLTYTSLGTDVREEVVRGLTRTLAVGLARYSTLAGYPGAFDVLATRVADDPTLRLVSPAEVDDPWDFWVFEVGMSGTLEGESKESEKRLGADVSASRTTDIWKLDFDFEGDWSRRDVELSDSSELTDRRTSWQASALTVYALADHWSTGVEAEAGASTYDNQDLSLALSVAAEYSFFPYVEAPRRALTAFYRVGPRYYDYEEGTIYLKTEETRFQQSLSLRLYLRQLWGNASASATWWNYLHDWSKNRRSLSAELSFRVFRGLNLDTSADVEWISDQLFLSAEGETDEDILLRRRRRETEWAYEVRVGFSYQFGSIYNNVVNNRFSRGRRH